MKKRIVHVIIAIFVVLVVVVEALAIWNFAPKRIFKDLSEEDVAAVYVLFGDSEAHRVPQEDVSAIFLGMLERVTLYGYVSKPDPSEMATGIMFPIWLRIELENGKTYEIKEAYPYVSINGKLFYTDYYALNLLRGKYDGWLESVRGSNS